MLTKGEPQEKKDEELFGKFETLRSRAAQSSLARVSEMQTGTLFLSV